MIGVRTYIHICGDVHVHVGAYMYGRLLFRFYSVHDSLHVAKYSVLSIKGWTIHGGEDQNWKAYIVIL